MTQRDSTDLYREFTDLELRVNHQFVSSFESLRKRLGFREMSDSALQQAAASTGLRFEDLRIARHLRNALAHDEPVNPHTLERYLAMLTAEGRAKSTEEESSTSPADRSGGSAFRVHAWRDPFREQQMIGNGFVSVGGEEIGDLSNVDDPEVIRRALTESMPDRSPVAINLFVGYWRRFLWNAKVGDVVVLPTQTIGVAIGEFAGEYFYIDSAEPRARHRRNVDWTRFGIPREEFDEDLQRVLSGRHSVQSFKTPDAVERLRQLARTDRT